MRIFITFVSVKPLRSEFREIKNPMKLKYEPRKKHFLIGFSSILLVLIIIRYAFPKVLLWQPSDDETAVATLTERPASNDTIMLHAYRVDSLLLRARPELTLVDAQGKPVKRRVTSVKSFQGCFPDLNDVQLATAQRIGIASAANREEAAKRKEELVYVGDNPFYVVKELTHSVPYLVPRASTLLTEISRAFVDSLASKGLPFHKLVVTSVLRTQHDISRLRRVNVNASENSCHQYGTTFDIGYNQYVRVGDPDAPAQPQTWGVTLKSVLAEVLEDQRQMGTCYVKYEHRQACFHITAR